MQKPLNRAERALALLTSRYPGWVPAIEFEKPCGRQGWRTAISEARAVARTGGDDIENRVQTKRDHATHCPAWQAWDIPGACDCGKSETWILSEYRLKRKAESQPDRVGSPRQGEGHDLNKGFELR